MLRLLQIGIGKVLLGYGMSIGLALNRQDVARGLLELMWTNRAILQMLSWE